MSQNLQELFQQEIERFSTDLQLSEFRGLANESTRQCMTTVLEQIQAHACAVWVYQNSDQGELLTIVHNVGGQGDSIEGEVTQSLDSGLVSKAFREKETICHQGWFEHPEKTADVDREGM